MSPVSALKCKRLIKVINVFGFTGLFQKHFPRRFCCVVFTQEVLPIWNHLNTLIIHHGKVVVDDEPIGSCMPQPSKVIATWYGCC